jgi:hypothetical protein
MTETQWRTCTSPEAMLNYLTERASPRKLRLYAIGCCRRIWHLFNDERCRHAVEMAQRFVDGRVGEVDLSAAGQVVASVARVWGDASSAIARATQAIGGAAWAATRSSAWLAAWDAAWDARMAARDFIPGTDWEQERAWQGGLLQDLFGNPFRPSRLDPTWLVHDDKAVINLARVIYDEDRFGDLPILADALEEAGCWDADVLGHCRASQPHYRGCWVVDAVLGHPPGGARQV